MKTYTVQLSDLTVLVNAMTKHEVVSLLQETTNIANEIRLSDINISSVYRHSNRSLIWGILSSPLKHYCPLNRLA